MDEAMTYWRKCGSCKKEIGFNTIYQVCNVGTCRKLVFCSVDCWNLHNPVMNHKSSWAEENRSPKKESFQTESSEGENRAPRRILIQSKPSSSNGQADEQASCAEHAGPAFHGSSFHARKDGTSAGNVHAFRTGRISTAAAWAY